MKGAIVAIPSVHLLAKYFSPEWNILPILMRSWVHLVRGRWAGRRERGRFWRRFLKEGGRRGGGRGGGGRRRARGKHQRRRLEEWEGLDWVAWRELERNRRREEGWGGEQDGPWPASIPPSGLELLLAEEGFKRVAGKGHWRARRASREVGIKGLQTKAITWGVLGLWGHKLGLEKKIIHCRINMSMLADGAGGGSLAKHTGGASKINWEQRGRRAATCAPSKSKKTPAKQTFSPPSSS